MGVFVVEGLCDTLKIDMIKRSYRTLLRFGKWLLLAALAVAVSIQLFSRVFFAFASHYRNDVIEFASNSLHQPIDIKSVHAAWYGIEPMIKLRGVTLYADEARQHQVVYIEKLNIGIDLVDSISARQWAPGEMVIKGASLKFDMKQSDKAKISLDALAGLLLTPGNKLLKNFELSWETPSGKIIQINNLMVKIKSSKHRHAIAASAKLRGTKARLSLWAKLNGNVIRHHGVSGPIVLQAQQVPMALFSEFLPPDQRVMMQGTLKQLWVKHDGPLSDFKDIEAQGLFENFGASVKAPSKLPSVKNISGAFRVTPQEGSFILQAENAEYDQPSVFRDSIPIKKLIGQINWQKTKDEWFITTPALALSTPDLHAKTSFAMNVPVDGGSPLVDGAVNFSINDLIKAKRYYPAKIMDQKLLQWLDTAILSGNLTQGKLALRGRLQDLPFDNASGRLIATAELNDTKLHYHDGWPDICHMWGHVEFDNQSMHLCSELGQTFGVSYHRAVASIPDLRKPVLSINGHLAADFKQGLDYIEHSPLKKELGKELAPLRLQGPMQLAVHMNIPLKSHQHDDIRLFGDVNLAEDTLSLPAWGINIEQLTGKFSFTEHGLSSDTLRGIFSDMPITIQLHTDKLSSDELSSTQVLVRGSVKAPSLAAAGVEGATPFTADLQLHRLQDDRPDEIQIRSDLKGMKLALPAPLQKSQSEIQPVVIIGKLYKNAPVQLQVNYNNQLQLAAKYWHNKLEAARVHFGQKEIELPRGPELIVDGHLKEFDLNSWFKVSSIGGDGVGSIQLPQLDSIDLSVDKLNVLGQEINDARVTLKKTPMAKIISLRSKGMNGDVTVPVDYPHHAIDATFDHLRYISKGESVHSNLQPTDVPPLNLTINDFWYQKLPLGRLELSVTPDKNSLEINQFSVKSKVMSLSATGQWYAHHKQHKTHLTGAMYAHNLGDMLNLFDVTDNMEEGNGRLLFNMNWDDSLVNYELSKVNGRLKLQFVDGQIVKLSEQAKAQMGIGRVLNLFSLQSLPRRLALDFRDLTQEGFDFEKLGGDFVMRNGNVFTKNATMQGSVATVAVHGRLGLKKKDYHLKLAITPHVTSSLPVVAAITGGPAAGVAAWIAEKVFSGAVNQVTTINYKVSGPWDHPVIQKQTYQHHAMR